MADKRIDELTAIDAIAAADTLAVYDASASGTRKATGTQVKAFATDVDINGLTTATPATGDYVPIYDISATANRKATIGDIVSLAGGGGGAGKLAPTLTPFAAMPVGSAFPEVAVINGRPALLFDASTEQTCDWALYVPAGLTGALSAKIAYAMASGTTGNVRWQVTMEAITSGDALNVTTNDSFAAGDPVDSAVPGTAGHLKIESVTLANHDNHAAGDYLRVRLARMAAHANDTATGLAYLFWLAIQEA